MTTVTGDANVLGAVAQILVDETTGAIADAVGQSASAAAALSALAHFLDRPTLDQLHEVLGLTPSGAVRLVDRLVELGFVQRRRGDDGRSRAVVLTARGQKAAVRVAAARAEVLNRALDDLSATERETLHRLLGKVMSRLVKDKDGGAWICRLCDTEACGRDAGLCPTANAAAVKYGSEAVRSVER